MRIAERIATNRTVAGVHFPVDSVAGMVLAQTLSDFFVARFTHGSLRSRTFDGRGFEDDFVYGKCSSEATRARTGSRLSTRGDQFRSAPNPTFSRRCGSKQSRNVGCSIRRDRQK